MLEFLLTLGAIIIIFVLPGLSLSRIFQFRFENGPETLFYSISLSFAAIVAVGFTLGATVGINVITVLVAFVIAGTIAVYSMARRLWDFLSEKPSRWRKIVDVSGRYKFRTAGLALLAITVTAFNWYSAIGTHAIDMGEHVFWAKTIIATGRLPNYLSVEPLDQAVKFTYAAHVMLAQFFLLAGVPIEEYTWIPTVIGSIALLCGVSLIAYRITESKPAALVAALLYGSASQPFGYIERGNLPDISGYLLLVATLYSLLRVRKSPSFSYALGLTAVSVIPTHQLATLILPLLLLFTFAYSYARCRSEMFETLRSIFASRAHQIFWILMLLLAFAYAATTTYIGLSAASQLVTGNWRPYVPALYDDVLVPGATLGFLGIAGIIAALPRKTLGFMILFGWTSTLIFLTNALSIGIPIPDPLRFLWRLTEPLSILGAVFVFSVAKRWRLWADKAKGQSRLAWISNNKLGSVGMLFLVLIISFQIVGLAIPALEEAPNVFSLPPRYRPVEAFYQDDKQVGLWLAANAPSTAVTTNDADVDATATWVQVYSMKLHFLYRADFATIVAPANYIQIYKGMAILYESPGDARVPAIIQQFNITYVVAHTDEIALFSGATSACFGHGPVFTSGGSALFQTRPC